MGFQLKEDKEAYSFKNFVKEMFFDSETDMVVISGVPGKESSATRTGKVLVGRDARGHPTQLADGRSARPDQRPSPVVSVRSPGQSRAQSLLG